MYVPEYLRTPIISLVVVTPLLALAIRDRDGGNHDIPRAEPLTAYVDIEPRLEATDQFSINAGPLPVELGELLDERELSYVYSFRDISAIKGNAVRGQLHLRTALQTMLYGTGCSYEVFKNLLKVSCKARDSVRSASDTPSGAR